MYPNGFFGGLSVEDFDWALLWRLHGPSARRTGYPSWCWAGWKGGVRHGEPQDVTKPRRFAVDLKMFRAREQPLLPIFEKNAREINSHAQLFFNIGNDSIDIASRSGLPELVPYLIDYPAAELDGYLFIDAIFLYFVPNFSRPRLRVQRRDEDEIFDFPIKDVDCTMVITSTDSMISQQRKDRIKTSVLITTKILSGDINLCKRDGTVSADQPNHLPCQLRS